MTLLRMLIAFTLWSHAAVVGAADQPDFFRSWTIEKPVCPGRCGKFIMDYITGFVGKPIDVGHDWFTNDMYESCRRGARYDEIKEQDVAQVLAPYKVKASSLGIRQKTVWAGRVFCSNTPLATLIYVNEKRMFLVFEQGVFVPLR